MPAACCVRSPAVRAVKLMAFVGLQHARDLFEWIDLNLAAGVCADPLVPAVDEYYIALGQIARLAYGGNRATTSTRRRCSTRGCST